MRRPLKRRLIECAAGLVIIGCLGGMATAQPQLLVDGRPLHPGYGPSSAGLDAMRRLQGQVPASSQPSAFVEVESLLSALTPPGSNVRVNDPTTDTGDHTTQNEVSLAVIGSKLCASYNDTGSGATNGGISRSSDLGTTWIDQGSVGGFPGDTVVVAHKASGTFLYGKLAISGIKTIAGVARSSDGCQTFSAFANASPTSAASNHLTDKPWFGVDNSGGPRDGDVYACWTRFVNNFGGGPFGVELRFSRSTDGGLTFVNDQVIDPAVGFGCHVDVGPNGEVYVAYADQSFSDFPIKFLRSTNGGLTWDPAVQINSLAVRPPGSDRVVACDGTRTTLNGDIRMLGQAWMGVDTTGGPYNGNIYVVWASDPADLTDNSDVYFSRSTDGGLTWAPEVQVAGGNLTDQFEPYLAVGPGGTVGLAWYDRRNDPTNNSDIDVYKTVSHDGGATWDPISRVTDVSFGVPPLRGEPTSTGNFDDQRSACYMGEYLAVAADATGFYYLWGDNRNTIVTSGYPGGRPDPDVYFDRLNMLVRGGAAKTDCALEWLTSPVAPKDGKGNPKNKLECTDDDPACDFGVGTGDTACTFHVGVCLNVEDARVLDKKTGLPACTPTDVLRLQIKNPKEAQPKDATDTANRDALETALSVIGGAVSQQCLNAGPNKGQLCTTNSQCDSSPGKGNGRCAYRFVAFTPALTATGRCTALAAIQVPLKSTPTGFKPGTRTIRISTTPTADPITLKKRPGDTDALTLKCVPHP